MDDEWISEIEWRERFQPIPNPFVPGSDAFEPGDPEQEAFVAEQPDSTVWSEMYNWSDDTSNLMSGYVPPGKDAIYWYVCAVPLEDPDGSGLTIFVELPDEW